MVMRAITARMGAASPMLAYGGITAIPTIAQPISTKHSIIAGLRPARSAYAPITNAPMGRVTNPAPNVASDSIRLP